MASLVQGLLNKRPENRLDWPDLLSHPFVKESEEERLLREQRLVCAASRAENSLAWKGEGGAIAGAAVYSGAVFSRQCTVCLSMLHTWSVPLFFGRPALQNKWQVKPEGLLRLSQLQGAEVAHH